MYFVYVLENSSRGWYIGQTDDLTRRLERHNMDMVKSTKNHGPWNIVYSETCNTRREAMQREEYLKSGRGRIYLKSKIA